MFLGLTLKWDYLNRTVGISMPNYVNSDLHKLHHPTPMDSQDAPHLWNRPTYGAAT